MRRLPAAGSCCRALKRLDLAGDDDMTGSGAPGAAYRRLLAWHPREFRHENESRRSLAVLIALPPQNGQRCPGPAEGRGPDPAAACGRGWRPRVPRSARTVRAAVIKAHVYAGAAVSTVNLVIQRALNGDIKGSASWLNTPFNTASAIASSFWPRRAVAVGWPGRPAGAGTGRASCPRCRRWARRRLT